MFTNDTNYILSLIVSSVLCGFLIGKIVTHRWFNQLLCKLHIGRTANVNIWDDVIKPHAWVKVYMKDGSSYMGQYTYGEPFKNKPIIVQSTYQKLDKDTNVTLDHTQNVNKLILIELK